MSFQPSAGAIHGVADAFNAKPDDDGSSPARPLGRRLPFVPGGGSFPGRWAAGVAPCRVCR